jgi:hypothetical protein
LLFAYYAPYVALVKKGIIVAKVNFAGHKVKVPGHPLSRIALGVALCVGGVLGFLPILGFWMIPLGLIVLSVDLPPVRRFRRRATVKLGHWLQKRWPNIAKKTGFGRSRAGKL